MHRINITILVLVGLLALPGAAFGDSELEFDSELSGAQSVSATMPQTIVGASALAVFDEGFTQVEVTVKVEGGVGVFAAHFHCEVPGAAGFITTAIFGPTGTIVGPLAFDGAEATGTLTNADFDPLLGDCNLTIGRPVNNLVALALAMREGLIYINLHTVANPAGEVRGQMIER